MDVHADIGRRFGADDGMVLRINAVAGREEYGINNFDGDRQLLSAAYDWRVRPGFSLKLDLEHHRKDVSEQAAIGLPTVSGRAVVPRIPDNKTNVARVWPPDPRRWKTPAAPEPDQASASQWLSRRMPGPTDIGNAD